MRSIIRTSAVYIHPVKVYSTIVFESRRDAIELMHLAIDPGYEPGYSIAQRT